MLFVVKNVKNIWDFIWNQQKLEAKYWRFIQEIYQIGSNGQLANGAQKHFTRKNAYHIPRMALNPDGYWG